MGAKTGIEWTDATWNPIRGCSRVSEGCRHCYAESVAYRFSGPGQPYEGLAVLKNGHASWTGKVEFVEKHLLDPLKWKAARRIFVNSMSDLFHEGVTDEMRDRIFAVMALCPQHTFQVLTKRPERMLAYLMNDAWQAQVSFAIRDVIESNRGLFKVLPSGFCESQHDPWRVLVSGGVYESSALPLPNVWLGVSVENQAAADERIPLLLQTPAAVRFLSCEPLLGPVALAASGLFLNWVICGGESGPGARPMHPDWARSLRDQCQAAGVPFFFKQHGEWISLADYDPFEHGWKTSQYLHQFAWRTGEKNDDELPISCYRVGKHAAGALLDGVEHKAFPEARA